jgi:hypothetical protein
VKPNHQRRLFVFSLAWLSTLMSNRTEHRMLTTIMFTDDL